MNILIHTQWFDPEPNTFKGLSFAKKLQEFGITSTVLTGFPNYPEGKIYKGYFGYLPKKEILSSITIYRSPLFPSHDRSSIKRSLNYLSFFLSSLLIGIFCPKPQLIFSYHPPITTALSSWLLSIFWRVPFVLDIQDLWPETLSSTKMIRSSIFLKIISFLCNFIYSRATKIIVLSKGFKQKLISRGVDKDKIQVIYNWCNEDYSNNLEKFEFPNEGSLNFVFAGNLGPAQDMLFVVKIFNNLQEKGKKIALHIYGEGTQKEEIREFLHEKNTADITLNNRVSDSEIKHIFKYSDILLVHLKNEDLFKITIPSKTQAYLFSGKPVLMAVNGEASDIIVKAKAGLVCNPQDPIDLEKTVEAFLNLTKNELKDMGSSGKSFYNQKMSMAKGVKVFSELFLSLIENPDPNC